ncbi:hypothetical protein [Ruminococcus flavefaciens]|uniref:hypothetical protein n=1 Tax=Ruminococcus flavefaciens TaxID=1265 RepID=UPI0026EC5945|nr:hypothetical protein [Ruminococcus flavefaciens]
MKKIAFIMTFILLFIIGFYIYNSYFRSYEGRNSKENLKASKLNHLYSSAFEAIDTTQINSDMIISSNSKIEFNNILNTDFYNYLNQYATDNDINIDDGVYYIEIRNKKVYKVIYSNWKYSGYVGSSPTPNGKCRVYQKEVEKSINEFYHYIELKT